MRTGRSGNQTQFPAYNPLGTALRDRVLESTQNLAETYYFGVTIMDRNTGIGGSSVSHRAGPYGLVVAPRHLATIDNNASTYALNYIHANTLVIPSVTTGGQYFTRGLRVTNLIMLCDKPANPSLSYSSYDRSVTNFYVPDDKVASYSGWAGLTPKPLSTFVDSGNKYSQMVKTLYERGILVRDWLDEE